MVSQGSVRCEVQGGGTKTASHSRRAGLRAAEDGGWIRPTPPPPSTRQAHTHTHTKHPAPPHLEVEVGRAQVAQVVQAGVSINQVQRLLLVLLLHLQVPAV